MIGLAVVGLMALSMQATSPQHAVLIRTGDDPVIVSVDLEAAPQAGCRFLEALIQSCDGGWVQPMGRGYHEVQSADGARIGVYQDGEPTVSGGATVRTGRWVDTTDVAFAGPAEREPGVAFDDISLIGPTPAQCGW